MSALSGLFVTFEGIDGTGKTTQVKALAQRWRARGREVVTTFEPGDTTLGKQIRQMLLSARQQATILPRTEALLYAADRAEHAAELIRPALRRGAIVLCDRYIDSSVAYQGAGRELSADEIRALSLWATHGLQPLRTYLLDMDPRAAHERIISTREGGPDRLEKEPLDFQARTRDEYLRLATADPGRFVIIDAEKPLGEITDLIDGDLRALAEAASSTEGANSPEGTNSSEDVR